MFMALDKMPAAGDYGTLLAQFLPLVVLSLGAGGVSKRVDRDTGWIERANNPKYPLEYIRAADRLANGKKKLLFSKK